MPINEAGGPKRSNLTKQQKRQAEAAIYGLKDTMTEPLSMTPAEVERMRQIVAQHDNASKVREFDLNNPPKEPYVYQPFPKMIYHHTARKFKVVHDDEQLTEHLAQGWDKQPFAVEVDATPALSAADQREVEALDAKIAAAKGEQADKIAELELKLLEMAEKLEALTAPKGKGKGKKAEQEG